MLRPSPNHGTQRLPNDENDDILCISIVVNGRNTSRTFLLCSHFVGMYSFVFLIFKNN